MPFVPSLITCTPTTGDLVTYFGKNTPEGRDTGSLGFLQWLLSAENRSGLRQLSDDIMGVPGKKRGLRLMYPEPVCIEICDVDFACRDAFAALEPAMQVVDLNIDTHWGPCNNTGEQAALTIDSAQFAQWCTIDDAQLFRDNIAKFDYRFLQELNKKFVGLLRAQFPGTAIRLPFIVTNSTTNTRQISDEWLLYIQEELDKAGIDLSDVVIMGGQFIRLVSQKFRVATASTQGIDYAAVANQAGMPAMYYDRAFDAAFGTNSFVVIPKGLLQFVHWNEYTGSRSFVGDTQVLFTKAAPLGNGSSITLDYLWQREPVCNVYTYYPSLYAELIKGICGNCDDPNLCGLLWFADCNANATPVCP